MEYCRARHRGACKAIEKHLSDLASLTATHYPELPLLFPTVDIYGFSELCNEGLVKHKVSFNPRDNSGSFSNISLLSYGRHNVYKATLEGTYFVLKEYSMPTKNDKEKMLREAKTLRKLNHTAVSSIDGIVLSDGVEAYLQIPYYSGGDMATWLLKHGKEVSSEQLRAVLHQIERAIDHLHTNKIIHCDIKLENVFMTIDSPLPAPKLGDFDISKDSDTRSKTTTSATLVGGTDIYIAPELLRQVSGANEASDIYAFGVLIFLAVSNDRAQIVIDLRSIAQLDVHAELTKRVSALSTDRKERSLILSMIDEDPEKRPRANSILQLSDSYLNVTGAIFELSQLEEKKKKDDEERDRLNPPRTCIICFCDYRLNEGIECPDQDKKHFLCNDCFSSNVSHQSSIDNRRNFAENQCQIVCPNSSSECSKRKPFADIRVAQNVRDGVFKEYLRAKEKILAEAERRNLRSRTPAIRRTARASTTGVKRTGSHRRCTSRDRRLDDSQMPEMFGVVS